MTFLNQINEPSNLNLCLMKQTFHKDLGAINNHQTQDTELKGTPWLLISALPDSQQREGAFAQVIGQLHAVPGRENQLCDSAMFCFSS